MGRLELHLTVDANEAYLKSLSAHHQTLNYDYDTTMTHDLTAAVWTAGSGSSQQSPSGSPS